MIIQRKCSHCSRRGKESPKDTKHHMINLVAINENNESYTCRFELCDHCMSNFALIFSGFSNDETIFDLMK